MRPAAVPTLAGLLLVPLACGSGDDAADGDSRTITVFAASSLTDAFTEIGEGFEAANPGTTVELSFGASSDLVDSITGGEALGTADVFASADESNMDELVEAGDDGAEPQVFARNQAEIAVPAGNPGDVAGIEDFADDGLFLGVCAPEVPCGAYAQEIFDNAGVTPSIDSEEAKVTDVVAKVASGDLDAGIVYVTDVIANDDDVDGVEIPDEFNVDAVYPIATVAEAPSADGATAFVDYVLSDAGQAVLADYGFLPPS
ncbi:MAG TPA: molybdate ABC transporter substrate-binding protein [Acidimicrobiales bacterium]|nr:molybdate ABC transporter substrate-binding protein [Acidimicrobiales bacterium]